MIPAAFVSYLHSILVRELGLFIFADTITTWIAINIGAREANKIPALLIASNPLFWMALILVAYLVIVLVTRKLEKHYKNNISILLLPAPLIIEAGAVINNVGVIRTLM